ncbi:MAG: GNAT family N-acetyltransferase [Gammaproteobacteria bacterium]|nr:GNAT family N-acetyltransferase [Gammaproteobacteria bacterium]
MPNNTPTLIRLAQAQDASALASLYTQLTLDPKIHILPERLTALRDQPHTRIYVAEHGGGVVGTLLLNLCTDIMYGAQPFAVLENLVVAEHARSLGIGKRLMAAAEMECQKRDCSKILLSSSAQRLDAHRFFEACGFSGSLKRGFVKYRREFHHA